MPCLCRVIGMLLTLCQQWQAKENLVNLLAREEPMVQDL